MTPESIGLVCSADRGWSDAVSVRIASDFLLHIVWQYITGFGGCYGIRECIPQPSMSRQQSLRAGFHGLCFALVPSPS